MDDPANTPPGPASALAEPEPPFTHPEEMRAAFDLRIGDRVSLRGRARTTPAGIATVGISVALVVAAFGFLAWAKRRAA